MFLRQYKIQAIRFVSLAGVIVFFAGCTLGQKQEAEGPVFYPPLPNSPYIQHLRSFTALKDIGGGGAFAEFVLGKESNEALVNKPYGVAIYQGHGHPPHISIYSAGNR